MSIHEASYAYNEDAMMAGIRAYQAEVRAEIAATAAQPKPAPKREPRPQPVAIRLEPAKPAPPIRPGAYGVIDTIAAHFGLSRKEIMGRTNAVHVVHPRQIAMYILREKTCLSLAAIARMFQKHHTTVIHATRKAEAMRAEGHPMAASIVALLTAEADNRLPQHKSEPSCTSRSETIIHGMAKHFGVTLEEILKERNLRCFVVPRRIAMLALRTSTDMSVVAIGRIFSMNHKSVIDGIRIATKMLAAAPLLAANLDHIIHYPMPGLDRKPVQSVVASAAESRVA